MASTSRRSGADARGSQVHCRHLLCDMRRGRGADRHGCPVRVLRQHVIGYGCCVGSWDKFHANVRPADGRLIVATSGQQHIAVAYNAILDAFMQYDLAHGDLEGVVLQHDDLEITDPAADDKIRALLKAHPWGVIGIAGATTIHGLDWWNAQTWGRQQVNDRMLQFGPLDSGEPVATHEAHMLEGSLLILGIEAARELRFDTRFVGFHGYDEATYRAWRSGWTVLVADIDTFHHTSLGGASKAKMDAWHEANRIFKEKWDL